MIKHDETKLWRAIFLDRDGVVNKAFVREGKPYPPDDLESLLILPGVDQALSILKKAGFMVIVVTNQPDVAKGIQKREVVETINNKLQAELPIDEIIVCYHQDSDNCECRKPRPGMLYQAAQKYNINLEASFLVGDRWKDIEAGHSVHCTTFFIDYGYDEPKGSLAGYNVHSLLEAALKIIDIINESKPAGVFP
jgi:D-glycero-D-manno-heptose 1,7-bisphosphate phosphatase